MNTSHYFAYFENIVLSTGEMVVRRWPFVEVRFAFCTACTSCLALDKTLRANMCVRAVHHCAVLPGGSCHGKVSILAPMASGCTLYQGGETIGTILMPGRRPKLLVSELLVHKTRSLLPEQVAYGEQFCKRAWHVLPPGILLGFSGGGGCAALHLAHRRGVALVCIVCMASQVGQWRDNLRVHAQEAASVVEYRIYDYDSFGRIVQTFPDVVCGLMVIVDATGRPLNLFADSSMQPTICSLLKASCCQFLANMPVCRDVRDVDIVLRVLGLEALITPKLEGEQGPAGHSGITVGTRWPPNPYADPNLLRRLLEYMRGRVALYDPRYCGIVEPCGQMSLTYHWLRYEISWIDTANYFLKLEAWLRSVTSRKSLSTAEKKTKLVHWRRRSSTS